METGGKHSRSKSGIIRKLVITIKQETTNTETETCKLDTNAWP